MGIIAANVVLQDTGIVLPEAYVATSRNTLMLNPSGADGAFTVHTAYNVWNSHQDRLAGKTYVQSKPLLFEYAGNCVPQTLYQVAYEHIKQEFPGCVDD